MLILWIQDLLVDGNLSEVGDHSFVRGRQEQCVQVVLADVFEGAAIAKVPMFRRLVFRGVVGFALRRPGILA